ncbi:torsin-1A-interacting 2 [Brachionus plicatilis]|uniref:Torsin-1A-interacting 2 n=1 Tax=Brachionus plicatilis TaxID=10195 RepID=A0A3M7T5G9_BRAPC|nr:torsin-1A-interacting 2 [Brachionus plicatilis]
MTDGYMEGLKNLSSRPDMRNVSTFEDGSSSENDDNYLDNSDPEQKEINNNETHKDTHEINEEHNTSQNSDGIDNSDKSSSDDQKQESEVETDKENDEVNSKNYLVNYQSECKKLDTNRKKSFKEIIFISVMVLLGSFLYRIISSKSVSKPSKYHSLKFDLIDELKQNYPNQSDHLWINIESCFKHSVVKSKDPSIILMIYDEQTASTYSKLSQQILKYLNKIDKSSRHVVLMENNKPDESKLYIDSKLSAHFKSGGKLALIEDIHQLPAHTMVLFYAYGDEEKYAKFPGVLIFMSLKLDEALDAQSKFAFLKSSKKLREFAEGYMFNLWSKWIGEDQLRPLFTRIANNHDSIQYIRTPIHLSLFILSLLGHPFAKNIDAKK